MYAFLRKTPDYVTNGWYLVPEQHLSHFDASVEQIGYAEHCNLDYITLVDEFIQHFDIYQIDDPCEIRIPYEKR